MWKFFFLFLLIKNHFDTTIINSISTIAQTPFLLPFPVSNCVFLCNKAFEIFPNRVHVILFIKYSIFLRIEGTHLWQKYDLMFTRCFLGIIEENCLFFFSFNSFVMSMYVINKIEMSQSNIRKYVHVLQLKAIGN